MALVTPQRVGLPGEAGRIEAVVELPQQVAQPAAFMVVCHPHPLHGGTMGNKVVTTLARTAHELGAATIRFNFRGVGASEGSFDQGRGEIRDALTAAAHGRHLWPDARLWLAGFSFGGVVALRASTTHGVGRVEKLLTVAPALASHYAAAREIQVPHCPWLVIQGEDDEVVDPKLVMEWTQALQPPPQVVLLPETGHFFHGALNTLQERAGSFLARAP
ncbi:MAG TPA: alpha/beta hydrolase [Steroidobacteraceae bacterium]|nr:alpha/beta hydrolase [Steroidobacteraceae bacterium]